MILDDNQTPWKSHKKWSPFLLIACLQRVKTTICSYLYGFESSSKKVRAPSILIQKWLELTRTSGAEEIHHPNPPDERSQIEQTLAPLLSNHNQLRRSGASSVIYQAAKTEGENFRCLLGKRYCLN